MNQKLLAKVNTESETDDTKVDELKLFQNILSNLPKVKKHLKSIDNH